MARLPSHWIGVGGSMIVDSDSAISTHIAEAVTEDGEVTPPAVNLDCLKDAKEISDLTKVYEHDTRAFITV
jgi:hypothetical protein